MHGAAALPGAVVATAAWWIAVTIGIIGGAAMLLTPDGNTVDRYGIPNGLTALRAYACVPLLFVATLSLPGRLALALWAGVGGAAGLLDAVDGFIARRWGPITVLGKAMDPFGDALFFVIGAIGCWTLGIVPLWLAILVVFRYAGPVVLTPLVLLTGRRPEFVYTVWGRRNTMLTGAVLLRPVLGPPVRRAGGHDRADHRPPDPGAHGARALRTPSSGASRRRRGRADRVGQAAGGRRVSRTWRSQSDGLIPSVSGR